MYNVSSYSDDEFINRRGAAIILGVSERTVRRYREEGKISFFRLSKRKIVYRVGDLRGFLRKSHVQPSEYLE